MSCIVTPKTDTNINQSKLTPKFYMGGLIEEIERYEQIQNATGSKIHRWAVKSSQLFAINNGNETLYVSWLLAPKDQVASHVDELNQLFPLDNGLLFSDLMSSLDLLKEHFSTPIGPNEQLPYNFQISTQTTSDDNEQIRYMTLIPSEDDKQCPHCASCQHYKSGQCKGVLESNGYKDKSYYDYNGFPVKIIVHYPTFKCPKSNPNFSIPSPKMNLVFFPAGRVTWHLVASVLNDINSNPEYNLDMLSRRYGVSDSLLEDIINCHYILRLASSKQVPCKSLVADEFYAFKGEYISVAIDPERSVILGMVVGKKKGNISMLFNYIKSQGHNIEILASDDNASFRTTAKECWGESLIWVLDHFHLKKKLSQEVVAHISRSIKKHDLAILNSTDKDEYTDGVLEHLAGFTDIDSATSCVSIVMKYAKSREALEADPSVPNKVKAYILQHPVLSNVLELRPLLDKVYECSDRSSASEALDLVIAKALEIHSKTSSIAASKKVLHFANYLKLRRDGILNYTLTKLTSSIIEGFNCKIKLLKRLVRGFTNPVSFMLRCNFAFRGKS